MPRIKKSIKRTKAKPMVKPKKMPKQDIMGAAMKPKRKKKVSSAMMPVDDVLGLTSKKAAY